MTSNKAIPERKYGVAFQTTVPSSQKTVSRVENDLSRNFSSAMARAHLFQRPKFLYYFSTYLISQVASHS